MEKRGWIALDIDGTITLEKYSVPSEVTSYLKDLQSRGWQIVVATGRPFTFASMALSRFDFPYIFLAQNGSLAMQMPEKRILFRNYMSPDLIPLVEGAYEGMVGDFVVYAGYEKGDFCYWRPKRFSKEEHRYICDLQKRQSESWQTVEKFDQMDPFPLIKCFGAESKMGEIAAKLRAFGKFQVAKIRDPFEVGYFILLVTDLKASKGNALSQILHQHGRGACVIAAGDDENDISLLNAADVKIAMSHAPQQLHQIASLIAPPTKELGIITALKIAIEQCKT